MRVVSKIHAHYMERFSHWETGLGKYAISWGAYEEPLGVFPEAELEYKEDAPEPFKKDQRGVHKISEAGRWKLTSSNETEDRIFDLDEEERLCPRCKGKLVWIGKELVREVFEYLRPKLKLVRYWQMSYKCGSVPNFV